VHVNMVLDKGLQSTMEHPYRKLSSGGGSIAVTASLIGHNSVKLDLTRNL
jgi:hypothetical protein